MARDCVDRLRPPLSIPADFADGRCLMEPANSASQKGALSRNAHTSTGSASPMLCVSRHGSLVRTLQSSADFAVNAIGSVDIVKILNLEE